MTIVYPCRLCKQEGSSILEFRCCGSYFHINCIKCYNNTKNNNKYESLICFNCDEIYSEDIRSKLETNLTPIDKIKQYKKDKMEKKKQDIVTKQKRTKITIVSIISLIILILSYYCIQIMYDSFITPSYIRNNKKESICVANKVTYKFNKQVIENNTIVNQYKSTNIKGYIVNNGEKIKHIYNNSIFNTIYCTNNCNKTIISMKTCYIYKENDKIKSVYSNSFQPYNDESKFIMSIMGLIFNSIITVATIYAAITSN